MRLDFLCPHHRLELLDDPARAADVWRDCDRRLRANTLLPSPTRLGLAGSALEAADIYLSATYLSRRDPSRYPTCHRRQSDPGRADPAYSATSFLQRPDTALVHSPGTEDDAQLLERYASSALHLMRLLSQAGQRRLALVVLAGANAMVEQVSRAGAELRSAVHACERLTREGLGLLGNREAAAAWRRPPALH